MKKIELLTSRTLFGTKRTNTFYVKDINDVTHHFTLSNMIPNAFDYLAIVVPYMTVIEATSNFPFEHIFGISCDIYGGAAFQFKSFIPIQKGFFIDEIVRWNKTHIDSFKVHIWNPVIGGYTNDIQLVVVIDELDKFVKIVRKMLDLKIEIYLELGGFDTGQRYVRMFIDDIMFARIDINKVEDYEYIIKQSNYTSNYTP